MVQMKASQSKTISPHHQTLIWAKLDTSGKEHEEEIVEGHGKWQDDTGFIVARVLVKPIFFGQFAFVTYEQFFNTCCKEW